MWCHVLVGLTFQLTPVRWTTVKVQLTMCSTLTQLRLEPVRWRLVVVSCSTSSTCTWTYDVSCVSVISETSVQYNTQPLFHSMIQLLCTFWVLSVRLYTSCYDIYITQTLIMKVNLTVKFTFVNANTTLWTRSRRYDKTLWCAFSVHSVDTMTLHIFLCWTDTKCRFD